MMPPIATAPLPSFGARRPPRIPVIRELEAFQREVLSVPEPVLVMFSMPLCQWCDQANPTLQRLAQTDAGRLKVVEVKVGTTAAPQSVDAIKETYDLSRKGYQGRGYPTFSLFVNGREAGRLNVNREIFQDLPGHLTRTLIQPHLRA